MKHVLQTTTRQMTNRKMIQNTRKIKQLLLMTEQLKNDKLYEKLQMPETENENLKSANRPKSQVKAASHAHINSQWKMKLLCQLPSLGLVLLQKKQVSHIS